MNLIRIGVAKALAPSVLSTSKNKINWEIKKKSQLKPLYEKVLRFLKGTDHGEYLAMKEIFGEEVSIRTALKGEMKVPGFVTNEQKAAVAE